MKLKSFEIKECSMYGENRGKFEGRISFRSDKDISFYMPIKQETCNKILELLEPELAASFQENIEILKKELKPNE